MRKITLLILLFIFLGINQSFSKRYGNHPVPFLNPSTLTHGTVAEGYTSPSGPNNGTWCNDDDDSITDTDYNKVAIDNSSTLWAPHGDNEVGIPEDGIINCLYRDEQDPSAILTYFNGWTNNVNQNIVVDFSDTGGSGLKNYVLQKLKSTNNPSFTSWGSRTTVESGNISSNSDSITYNYIAANYTAYKFRIIITDIAGNTKTIDGTQITKIDLINPNISDVSSVTGTKLLAYDNQNIQISISNNTGAPIKNIQGFFEKYDSCSNQFGLIIDSDFESFSSGINSATLEIINKNISEVDILCDFDNGKGGRFYSYKITYIEDYAGNSIGVKDSDSTNIGLKTIDYEVYATTLSANFSTHSVTLEELSDPLNIADGSIKKLEINLKDNYGNQIINSSGINRKIYFNFYYDNNLNSNQYNRTGTGIYSTIANEDVFADNFNLGSTNSKFYHEESIDGKYIYKFKIIAPTYSGSLGNGQELVDPEARFIINYIELDVTNEFGENGTNTGIILDNSIAIIANAQPIFNTSLSGNLDSFGIREGATQDSIINVTEKSSVGTISNKKMYIEFGSGFLLESPNLKLKANLPNLPTGSGSVGEGLGSLIGNDNKIINNDNIIDTDILTLLNFDGGITGIDKSYISTHVSYEIDGYDIVYNSYVYGKTNYFIGVPSLTTYDEGLKIIGIAHSNKQVDLSVNQEEEDIHILGNIEKSSLKEQVSKNVYSIVKNLDITNGTTQKITNLASLNLNEGGNTQVKDVLYYGNEGSDLIVNISSDDKINGQKTIVTIGKNIYIDKDILRDNNEAILGIIALKDKNGNGGKIYIDPSVTIIEATIYADKSLISYDGSDELDGSTSQGILNNQLYIYGSVFSENTIGGSRNTPNPICPFYIIDADCDLETAQKYDLNYLRRYYVSGGTASNGGVNFFTDYNGTGTNYYGSGYPYYNYPIVIKYNPIIQTSPPPFFESK